MTYNVFGGTLSLTQSINQSVVSPQIQILCGSASADIHVCSPLVADKAHSHHQFLEVHWHFLVYIQVLCMFLSMVSLFEG